MSAWRSLRPSASGRLLEMLFALVVVAPLAIKCIFPIGLC
jgi:hypothetical protein